MVHRGGEFNFFHSIHWCKNLDLHFYKTYGHQIWQAGTFQLNKTIQADASNITSGSRDKLKSLYLHYHNASGYQIWQDGNYLDGLLLIILYDLLITWSCKITWQTKITLSPLSQCFWPPNLAGY